MAQPSQFTLHAAMAPGRVLRGQTQHQIPQFPVDRANSVQKPHVTAENRVYEPDRATLCLFVVRVTAFIREHAAAFTPKQG
ncbi:hypothetical protein GCM10027610_014760 [Dactylosporangium cerinum]